MDIWLQLVRFQGGFPYSKKKNVKESAIIVGSPIKSISKSKSVDCTCFLSNKRGTNYNSLVRMESRMESYTYESNPYWKTWSIFIFIFNLIILGSAPFMYIAIYFDPQHIKAIEIAKTIETTSELICMAVISFTTMYKRRSLLKLIEEFLHLLRYKKQPFRVKYPLCFASCILTLLMGVVYFVLGCASMVNFDEWSLCLYKIYGIFLFTWKVILLVSPTQLFYIILNSFGNHLEKIVHAYISILNDSKMKDPCWCTFIALYEDKTNLDCQKKGKELEFVQEYPDAFYNSKSWNDNTMILILQYEYSKMEHLLSLTRSYFSFQSILILIDSGISLIVASFFLFYQPKQHFYRIFIVLFSLFTLALFYRAPSLFEEQVYKV